METIKTVFKPKKSALHLSKFEFIKNVLALEGVLQVTLKDEISALALVELIKDKEKVEVSVAKFKTTMVNIIFKSFPEKQEFIAIVDEIIEFILQTEELESDLDVKYADNRAIYSEVFAVLYKFDLVSDNVLGTSILENLKKQIPIQNLELLKDKLKKSAIISNMRMSYDSVEREINLTSVIRNPTVYLNELLTSLGSDVVLADNLVTLPIKMSEKIEASLLSTNVFAKFSLLIYKASLGQISESVFAKELATFKTPLEDLLNVLNDDRKISIVNGMINFINDSNLILSETVLETSTPSIFKTITSLRKFNINYTNLSAIFEMIYDDKELEETISYCQEAFKTLNNTESLYKRISDFMFM